MKVITGDELRTKYRPIYTYHNSGEMMRADLYPLAVDKVRHIGEPVVAVVARSKAEAVDAVELVKVEFEPLKVVVDAEAALASDSTLLYEEWGSNVMLHHAFSNGDFELAKQEADVIVKERIYVHRHSPVPIEPNGCVAEYDRNGVLTLWVTTQTPHILRTILAETIGIAEPMIRVVEPDVGGGFGGKMPIHLEDILVCFLAVELKSAVKYIEQRSEHLIASHQAREQVHYIEAALKKDGTILGIKDKMIGNLGVYLPNPGPASLITTSRFIPGCYKIRNYEVEVFGVATNKATYGAYRGFGKDAASYVIEKLMDVAARKLNLSPVDIRLRNLIRSDELPYRTATGALYDSGNYAACLKNLLDRIDYDHLKEEQAALRKRGRHVGIGLSFALEPAASHFPGTPNQDIDGTMIRLEPTGKFSVFTGVTSTGTGSKTTFAQIAADELGVPFEDVFVVQGDTNQGPYGRGTWASRGVVVGGNSVLFAARRLRQKILRFAAHLNRSDEADLSIQQGFVVSALNSKIRISMRQLASSFYLSVVGIPNDILEEGMEATSYFMPRNVETVPNEKGERNAYATYGYSACAAMVEVDLETGFTRVLRYVCLADAGRIVNPQILEAQMHGGIVQGIAGAIFEENKYAEDGLPLASTFIDYLIPTAVDVPKIEVSHLETPSPFVPLGSKGAGEGPIIGVYAALSNAVEDALEPFGTRIRELPLSPEYVWNRSRSNQGAS